MVDQPTPSPVMSHLLNEDPKDDYSDPMQFTVRSPKLIRKQTDTVYSNRSSLRIVRSLRRDSGILSPEVYYYEPVEEDEFGKSEKLVKVTDHSF
ncbi:unnamed protein product [Dibothriocephalus latus]|uniref:Uncharacterized protein n=1 Tax=Dibothriocephalus latus TaxID=60516 RepID=A0A3P7N3M2_DIBLA|nr:unnamed protein product [Dibothriocephalus latus]